MKKVVIALLFVSFGFTACNAQASENKKNTNQKKVDTMKTIQLTKADFLSKVANYEANPSEWKYLGDKPAIIDFYASWCGPCKMIAPILEELAAEYGDSIYIYKIDTEKEQELASVFGIRSIPTLLFVPMEGAPQMAQGAMPKSSLKEAIDNVLLK
ncbi:thioredoxin [Parabacteroides sp. PFB2-10]|uniref:thioredoxin n=1 Tax=Parabacteroides sp. PFB2-10 TaxID=1742405 RepID=UPI0024733B9E|nr:thioredoxin [Parabacteroides sp. PFB2-10]MDH6311939.1 thioredoxin [Parabacteroides sp. PFB2-10]